MSEHKLTHVLIAGGAGYWGKGTTDHEAIANSKWLRAGDRVLRVECTEAAYCEDGRFVRPKDHPMSEAVSGRVVKIRNEWQFKPLTENE